MAGKRFAYSMLAAFAVIFIFEWVFHGMAMMPWYGATAELWRPPSEMNQLFAFILLRQLLQAGILTCIFIRLFEARGTEEKFSHGLWVGALMGIIQFGSYAYLAIPLSLAVAWLAGEVFLGILVAFVVGTMWEKTPA